MRIGVKECRIFTLTHTYSHFYALIHTSSHSLTLRHIEDRPSTYSSSLSRSSNSQNAAHPSLSSPLQR